MPPVSLKKTAVAAKIHDFLWLETAPNLATVHKGNANNLDFIFDRLGV